MSITFESLPSKKQHKILNAAIEEFAQAGYEAASTNSIVEKAAISKGILFHYFRSKKELYLYVVRHCLTAVVESYYTALPSFSSDVFERIKQLTLLKLQQVHLFPLEYQLLAKMLLVKDQDIQAQVTRMIDEQKARATKLLLDGIDLNRFKAQIDVQKAMEVIFWTLEAYSNKYLAQHTDVDGNLHWDEAEILKDMEEYINLLKVGLYN